MSLVSDNPYYELTLLKRRICKLEQILLNVGLIELQVNDADNDSQILLDLIDSSSIAFTDLGDGKVTATAKTGAFNSFLDIFDTYEDLLVDLETNHNKRFIKVISSSANNGDMTLYLYDGTVLDFIQTIAE